MIRSGGIRRGLHIEDDDEPKPTYQYQKLDADREKGKFQKDLDAMLFGGMAPAPSRRRAPQPVDGKPAEQPKTAEQVKNTAELVKNTATVNKQIKTNGPIQSLLNTLTKPVQPTQNAPSSKVQAVTKPSELSKPPIYPSKVGQSVKTSLNYEVTHQSFKGDPTKQSKLLNYRYQDKQTITTRKAVDAFNKNGAEGSNSKINQQIVYKSKVEAKNNNQASPMHKPVITLTDSRILTPQPTPIKILVPLQPIQAEQIQFQDHINNLNRKMYNKPGPSKKTMKQAEDYNFSQQNIKLHMAVDVVRPVEIDRTRQRKLNDFQFKDYQFPPMSISLGKSYENTISIWKKPNQISTVVNFGKYVDANNINLGLLSSPHLASTIACLCESQLNIKRLIQDQRANQNGFYLIRLFLNSVWRYIAVDGYLPFIENNNVGIMSRGDSEMELCYSLIEKAYAKLLGSYELLGRLESREHYLRDLTGAPVTKYSIDNHQLSGIVKKALAEGKVVIAVPAEKIIGLGLNPDFSYSVLGYSAKGNMQLRNSWGTLEQKSKLITKPQGIFQLSPSSIHQNLSHILISNLHLTYYTTTIQAGHRLGFYSSFNFKIRKTAHGYLTVSQWDRRLFPESSGYDYSPFHLVVHKREGNQAALINAVFNRGSRNLDLQVNLSPGNYTVFVAGHWKIQELAYNLTFYGSENITFQRNYVETIPNSINLSLQELNIEQGIKTQLSPSTNKYLYYHPQSNFIVLTVQNTTYDQVTVCVDLSTVKFQHLILLTSYNNQQHYAGKDNAAIDDYKHIPTNDRKWQVQLGEKKRFTWILAADQPYNEINTINWGFK